MRIKKERKPIHLHCVDCLRGFVAYNGNALRCPECRKSNAIQQQRELRAMQKAKAEYSRKGSNPKMSIGEVIKAMERYNKAHHTHYTYGQFVSLMEGGKIYG
jgi:predicted ATP-dependent serine protease